MAPNDTATPEHADRVDAAPDSTSAPGQRPYGVNRWTLLGRMTATPELRYTPSGTPVLNVGIATSSGGKAHFHDVVAWARSAEILAEFGRKGARCTWKAVCSRSCATSMASASSRSTSWSKASS